MVSNFLFCDAKLNAGVICHHYLGLVEGCREWAEEAREGTEWRLWLQRSSTWTKLVCEGMKIIRTRAEWASYSRRSSRFSPSLPLYVCVCVCPTVLCCICGCH